MAKSKEVASQDYEQAPEYQQHVQAVLKSYEHPSGLLGELVRQLADAFWWIRSTAATKRTSSSHKWQVPSRSGGPLLEGNSTYG